jgi:hypothetical protein
MTESRVSKHAIVCDNCNKIFYFENVFEEHLPCYVRHPKLKTRHSSKDILTESLIGKYLA